MNPQLDNSVNKRVFSNSRTLPIPTNPSGIALEIRNISRIIDMFQLTAPNTHNPTTLPSPAAVLAASGN